MRQFFQKSWFFWLVFLILVEYLVMGMDDFNAEEIRKLVEKSAARQNGSSNSANTNPES